MKCLSLLITQIFSYKTIVTRRIWHYDLFQGIGKSEQADQARPVENMLVYAGRGDLPRGPHDERGREKDYFRHHTRQLGNYQKNRTTVLLILAAI